MTPRARATIGILFGCLAAGCAGQIGEDNDEAHQRLTTPTGVPAGVYVNGVYHDLETDYLPHVVQCENGGAPTESLKAQAIAARTFLIASVGGQSQPHIGDGQQWQVYGCGSAPSAEAYAAAEQTAGVYLTYNGAVANGQFVAGALTGGSCQPAGDPTYTERYVTRNEGLSGSAIHRAPYPLANPSNPQNRGCMGQNLANCLANDRGYDALSILRSFYGADIEIVGTFGEGSGEESSEGPTQASCAELGYFGRCDGPIAQWAEDGQCKLRDCPAEGTGCGYISDSEGWGCLNVDRGGTTFTCADTGYHGDCRSNWLIWAEDGACRTVDCTALGRTCDWVDDSIGFNCI